MTEATMRQIQDQLATAWQKLVDVVEAIPDRELEQPGVVGDWSVKDLLGHIAFWNERPVLYMKALLDGTADKVEMPKDMADADVWNEREWKRRRELPLATVRRQWLDSFEAVRQALETFPVERLAERIQGRPLSGSLAGDTVLHYQEHLEQIRAWQRQLETTEA